MPTKRPDDVGQDEITPICAVVSVRWGLFRLSHIVPHRSVCPTSFCPTSFCPTSFHIVCPTSFKSFALALPRFIAFQSEWFLRRLWRWPSPVFSVVRAVKLTKEFH
jgi:hypothetical protein